MADQTYIEPVVKSQPIRLLDIFVIGPLMVVGGAMLWKRSKVVSAGLVGFGLTTVAYNLINYLKVQKLKAE